MIEKDTNGIVTLANIGVGGERGWIYSADGLIGALSATQYKDPSKTIVNKEDKRSNSRMGNEEGYRIRKLTPLECWRLMAFSDEDFRAAESTGVSNSQLYKQAGNSLLMCCITYSKNCIARCRICLTI